MRVLQGHLAGHSAWEGGGRSLSVDTTVDHLEQDFLFHGGFWNVNQNVPHGKAGSALLPPCLVVQNPTHQPVREYDSQHTAHCHVSCRQPHLTCAVDLEALL